MLLAKYRDRTAKENFNDRSYDPLPLPRDVSNTQYVRTASVTPNAGVRRHDFKLFVLGASFFYLFLCRVSPVGMICRSK